LTTDSYRQITVNIPKGLFQQMENTKVGVGEPSVEEFILKLILGGIVLIDQELEKRKLIVTPALVAPDGRYVGSRRPSGQINF